MSVQSSQVLETVDARAVAVAEIKADRVIAYLLPAEHTHVGKRLPVVATVNLSKNVFFAAGFRRRGRSTQEWAGEIAFRTIAPSDRDFVSDELNVLRRFQKRESG